MPACERALVTGYADDTVSHVKRGVGMAPAAGIGIRSAAVAGMAIEAGSD